MVRGRADSFAKADIADEAQFPIWNAERTALGVQKKLLQSYQVAGHLAADFPSLQTSFGSFAAGGVRRLGNAQDACAHSILPAAAANDEVGAN
jgi:hypothetical protein